MQFKINKVIILILNFLTLAKSDEDAINETIAEKSLHQQYNCNDPLPDTFPARFRNVNLDCQNPDSLNPPRTDAGGLPPFKYPYSFSNRQLYNGGWRTQVMSVNDLPIATAVSSVIHRLYRGGIREMHWHINAEWSYVIYGHARITAVDPQGRGFVEDVKAGDVWFFPDGYPHAVQGIGNDGVMYVLAYNSGTRVNDILFELDDLLRHFPEEVLAKNFQIPKSVFNQLFANIPQPDPFFIFEAQLPRPLQIEQEQVSQGTGTVPQSFKFCTSEFKPNVTRRGGEVTIVDARNFPVAYMAGAIVTLRPGALREVHWHDNADEWQYYVTGRARMTVFYGNGQARTMDFEAGDIGYVQQSKPHYIENTCNEDVIYLEVFATAYYSDISLAQWLAHTPSRLVNEHIRTGEPFINSIRKSKAVIVP